MRGFPVKTETSLDNTHENKFICHLCTRGMIMYLNSNLFVIEELKIDKQTSALHKNKYFCEYFFFYTFIHVVY